MAADETLQSPGQQIIVTILGVGVKCQPYVLYQTSTIWHLSHHLYVRLPSTVIVWHVFVVVVILCRALFLYLRNSIQQQQLKQPGWLNEGGITRLISLLPVTFWYNNNLCLGLKYFDELKLSEQCYVDLSTAGPMWPLIFTAAFCDWCVATKLWALHVKLEKMQQAFVFWLSAHQAVLWVCSGQVGVGGACLDVRSEVEEGGGREGRTERRRVK